MRAAWYPGTLDSNHLRLVSAQEPTSPDLVRLVEAARRGEQGPLRALYERCYASVERLAFRLMPHHGEAEDLIQDAFIQAFQSLDRLEDPARFEAWLRRIVIGTAHKKTRRFRLFRPVFRRASADDEPDLDDQTSPAAGPEVQAELVRLARALNRLPDEERIVFVLRRVEGLTVAEIAAATELSEATVKRRLTAAANLLEGWGGHS